MLYTTRVPDFEWDDANVDHIAMHGVEPEEAEEALADPHRRGTPVYNLPAERRRGITGQTLDGRVIVVIYTWRQGAIRVVSARDANARERRSYHR